jgi:hypothetical protein
MSVYSYGMAQWINDDYGGGLDRVVSWVEPSRYAMV